MKINDGNVTNFLDELNHPLRREIEELRFILNSYEGLSENIKWNAPNYSFKNQDRITMKIFPHNQIQLIFHRGAKKLEQPSQRLIDDTSGILVWKENDRAIVSFKKIDDVIRVTPDLKNIIALWLQV